MKLTEQQLAEVRTHIPSWISDDLVTKTAAMFPEGMAPKLVQSMLVENLSGLKEGIDDSAALKKVQNAFQNLKKGQDAKNPGNAKQITRDYYDSLLLEMRLMGTQQPSAETTLFGVKMASPIMTAALSHLKTFNPDAESPMEEYARAALMTGVVHWVGMTENDEYAQIAAVGAPMVRIVKPYADEAKCLSQLDQAKELGAVAVGMDIDHTFTKTGAIDIVMGEPMEVKSLEQMRLYAERTGLPFVVKGILSAKDALLCREIGASGIVVSHHGGRLPFAMPPAAMLPEIRDAVGKEMTIICDCGIASGLDAYKALALGADAVGVGTHLSPIVVKEGAEACAARLEEMTEELRGAMAYTGVETCAGFDRTVIHRM